MKGQQNYEENLQRFSNSAPIGLFFDVIYKTFGTVNAWRQEHGDGENGVARGFDFHQPPINKCHKQNIGHAGRQQKPCLYVTTRRQILADRQRYEQGQPDYISPDEFGETE